MKPFKKIICFCLILITVSLMGCKEKAVENKVKMSPTMPKDFNFIFNYGIGAKNELDTSKGQFTKDMVAEPSITTDLKLTEDEMKVIYDEMYKINLVSYPESYTPKNKKKGEMMVVTPHSTYSIKLTLDGKEQNIFWTDINLSQQNDAIDLRALFNKIIAIIQAKEEYKKLPEPTSAYQ